MVIDPHFRWNRDTRQVVSVLTCIRQFLRMFGPSRHQGDGVVAPSQMNRKRRAPSTGADDDKIHASDLTADRLIGTEILRLRKKTSRQRGHNHPPVLNRRR